MKSILCGLAQQTYKYGIFELREIEENIAGNEKKTRVSPVTLS